MRRKFQRVPQGSLSYVEFCLLCDEVGAKPTKCSENHFQAKDGPFVKPLNYYPQTGTFYMSGAAGGRPSADPKKCFRDLAASKTEACWDGAGALSLRQKKAFKKILWSKQRRCRWCNLPFSSINDATIEHLIPRSRGGSNQLDNLSLSHEKCNQERGNSLLAPACIRPIRGDEMEAVIKNLPDDFWRWLGYLSQSVVMTRVSAIREIP